SPEAERSRYPGPRGRGAGGRPAAARSPSSNLERRDRSRPRALGALLRALHDPERGVHAPAGAGAMKGQAAAALPGLRYASVAIVAVMMMVVMMMVVVMLLGEGNLVIRNPIAG